MPDTMQRLLLIHEFLDDAVKKHGADMPAECLARTKAERDDAFMNLLTHQSTNVGVTFAQLSCVLLSMSDHVGDSEQAKLLKSLCVAILERHRQNIGRMHVPAPLPRSEELRGPSPDWRTFDLLADRVAVFDRDYRYVFTNVANARYHGKSPEDFVGRLGWRMVGRKCFDNHTRPLIAKGFAGKTHSQFTGHNWTGSRRTWFVSVAPVRGADKEITSVILVCKDVTAVPIPAEKIVMLPTQWASLYSRNKNASARRMRTGG